MKKMRFLSVLLAVLMIVALTGCVGSAGSSTAEPASTADSGAESASDSTSASSGNTITYASMWTESEPQALWLADLAKSYEAEKGTKVEITWVGRDVLNQVKTQILAGNAPDLIDQDHSELSAAFLSEDEQLIMPLDDLLNGPGPEGEATFREVFNTAFLDLYKFQDHDYFVPYNLITSGFYYNKTMWDEMGIKAPQTWDEFIALIDTFKAAGKSLCAQDNDPMYNAYWYYWACERVMGAGKLYAAATDATGAAWDDPGYLEAAKLVYEVSKGDKNAFQAGYEGSVWPAGQQDFALGNEGCLLCGTWIPVELKDTVDSNWEWGYFPFPTVEGGVGQVTDMEAYLIGFCIPNGAKNPDGAKDFLLYISTSEHAQGLVNNALCMHARADAPIPSVLAEVEPYLKNAKSFHLSYDGVASKCGQWNADVFYTYGNQLFHGEITPEEFISQMKAATIAFYANK